MASIWDWSTTAASNSNADSGINWAEGQAPSSVNNSARQVMARIAELLVDLGGATAAGGTGNAITLATTAAFTALADGRIVAFEATADNTGATTLNVNSVGAKSVRKITTAGEAALVGGEIQSGGIYVARYLASADSSSGGWILTNPTFDVVTELGYTPVDVSGDTITGALTVEGAVTAEDDLSVGGDLTVTGSITPTGAVVGYVPTSRTVSASGLATGGGALSSNQTITVTEASLSEATTGTASNVAMTPRRTKSFVDSNIYTGSTAGNTSFPIGTVLVVQQSAENANAAVVVCLHTTLPGLYVTSGNVNASTPLSGTWRARGIIIGGDTNYNLVQRTA